MDSINEATLMKETVWNVGGMILGKWENLEKKLKILIFPITIDPLVLPGLERGPQERQTSGLTTLTSGRHTVPIICQNF